MAVNPAFSCRRAKRRRQSFKYYARMRKCFEELWARPASEILACFGKEGFAGQGPDKLFNLIALKNQKANRAHIRSCPWCLECCHVAENRAKPVYDLDEWIEILTADQD